MFVIGGGRKIMRQDVAEEIVGLMLEYGDRLDGTIRRIQDTCDEKEFSFYRKAIGKIMGYMLTDIMNPIFSEYPQLKPDGLK